MAVYMVRVHYQSRDGPAFDERTFTVREKAARMARQFDDGKRTVEFFVNGNLLFTLNAVK